MCEEGTMKPAWEVRASRWMACAALVLAFTLGMAATASAAAADRAGRATRQRFLAMFARAYYPGRTGQLLVVPRRGDFITRPDPYYTQMHGSPWPYDVDIPVLFVGPAVKAGRY